MSVIRINTFLANAGMTDALHTFLESVIDMVTRAEGCENCQLLQSRDNAHELVIIEKWVSVDAHLAAAKAIPPEKIAAVMPLLAAPPRGSYYD